MRSTILRAQQVNAETLCALTAQKLADRKRARSQLDRSGLPYLGAGPFFGPVFESARRKTNDYGIRLLIGGGSLTNPRVGHMVGNMHRAQGTGHRAFPARF